MIYIVIDQSSVLKANAQHFSVEVSWCGASCLVMVHAFFLQLALFLPMFQRRSNSRNLWHCTEFYSLDIHCTRTIAHTNIIERGSGRTVFLIIVLGKEVVSVSLSADSTHVLNNCFSCQLHIISTVCVCVWGSHPLSDRDFLAEEHQCLDVIEMNYNLASLQCHVSYVLRTIQSSSHLFTAYSYWE